LAGIQQKQNKHINNTDLQPEIPQTMMAYVLGYSACLDYYAYYLLLTEKFLAPVNGDDGLAVCVALMMHSCWRQPEIDWTKLVGLAGVQRSVSSAPSCPIER
jgi:hypothetical protein